MDQKKRTQEQVYDNLLKFANYYGYDLGLDKLSREQFVTKYGDEQGVNTLYDLMSELSDSTNKELGIGTREEWLRSFGYGSNPTQRVKQPGQVANGSRPSGADIYGTGGGQPRYGYSGAAGAEPVAAKQPGSRVKPNKQGGKTSAQQSGEYAQEANKFTRLAGQYEQATGRDLSQDKPEFGDDYEKGAANYSQPTPMLEEYEDRYGILNPSIQTKSAGEVMADKSWRTQQGIEHQKETGLPFGVETLNVKRPDWASLELNDAYKERDRLDQEIRRRTAEVDKSNPVTWTSGLVNAESKNNPTFAARANDPELSMLWTAKKDNEKRIQILEREEFDEGFLKTIGKILMRADTWDFGMSDLKSAEAKLIYGDKTQDDGSARAGMMRNAADLKAAEDTYNGNDTKGQRFGRITAEMLPFVLEFWLTGGMNGMTELGAKFGGKAATKMGLDAAENKLAHWAVKSTGTLLGDFAASMGMANTVAAGKTWSDIIDRHLGDVSQDFAGNYRFANGKGWAQSIYEGEVANTLEYFTEKLGMHMHFGKWIGKGAEKFGLSKISSMLVAMDKSAWRGIFEKIGVSDYPSEVLEEEINLVANALLVGDNSFSRDDEGWIFDKQTQTDIWLGMAASLGCMKVPAAGVYVGIYYNTKHQVDKADKIASSRLTEERWVPIRGKIDNTTNENMRDVAVEIIVSRDLNNDEKKAALDYMSKLTQLRGMNLRNMADTKVGPNASDGAGVEGVDLQRAAVTESFTRGYNATDQEAEDIVTEYKMAGYSDDDFAEVQAAYEGLMARVRDDLDNEFSVRGMIIDRMTNEDGHVYMAESATTDANGKPMSMFVIKGKVVMLPDGSGIDTQASDKTVTLFDPSTGRVIMAAPGSSTGIVSVQDIGTAQDMRDKLDAEREASYNDAMDQLHGVVSVNPGDQFLMPNGVSGTVVAVSGNDVTVQTEDGETTTMSAIKIQQDADAKRIADYTERNGKNTNTETEVKPAVVGAQTADEYAPNTRIRVRDDGGAERDATITARGRMSEGSKFIEEDGGPAAQYIIDGEKLPRYFNVKKPGDTVIGIVQQQEQSAEPTDAGQGEQGDTVGPSPVALSYLLEGGPGTIQSTGYLLHGIAAAFPEVSVNIETARSAYMGQYDDNPSNFKNDTTGALDVIRGFIEEKYGSAGVDILNEILNNATGFYPKQGALLQSKIESLTANYASEETHSDEASAPTPAEEYAALVGDESLEPEEVTAYINNNVATAQKALDDVMKQKPKMGTDLAAFKAEKESWNAQVEQATADLARWNALKEQDDSAHGLAEEEQRKAEEAARLEGERIEAERIEAERKAAEEKAAAEKAVLSESEVPESITVAFAKSNKEVPVKRINDENGKIRGYSFEGVNGLRADNILFTFDEDTYDNMVEAGIDPSTVKARVTRMYISPKTGKPMAHVEIDVDGELFPNEAELNPGVSFADVINSVLKCNAEDVEAYNKKKAERERAAEEARLKAEQEEADRKQAELEAQAEAERKAMGAAEKERKRMEAKDAKREETIENVGRVKYIKSRKSYREKVEAAKMVYRRLSDQLGVDIPFEVDADSRDCMEFTSARMLNKKMPFAVEDTFSGADGLLKQLGGNMKFGGGRRGDWGSVAWSKYFRRNGNGYGVWYIANKIAVDSDLGSADGQMFTDGDVRDAIINLFLQAKNPTDITEYILNNAIDRAEQAISDYESRYKEELEHAVELGYVSPEEEEVLVALVEHNADAVRGMSEEEFLQTLYDVNDIIDEWNVFLENGAKSLSKLTNEEYNNIKNEQYADAGTETSNDEARGRRGAEGLQNEKDEQTGTSSADEQADGRMGGKKRNQSRIASREVGGVIADHLNKIGIETHVDVLEYQHELQSSKQDKSDAGKPAFIHDGKGRRVGFTRYGKIFLDPRRISAEAPIHEYSHLWCKALQLNNPKTWGDIVEILKQDEVSWSAIVDIIGERASDNDIASEFIAKYSGKKGADRLEQEFARMKANSADEDYKRLLGNALNNIKKAIQDFWRAVADYLHIEYKSAEQVYDQVLRDFADSVNPVKAINNYISSVDAEYKSAVEEGNTARATEIFNNVLSETIGNGTVPFISVDRYRRVQNLAHAVKTRDEKAVRYAAEKMAPLVPKNAVLIPMVSHEGMATDMLDLAKAIADIAGCDVADILESNSRQSQYEAKKEGRVIPSSELGIRVKGGASIPEGKIAVVVDNVVGTGNTAKAAVNALGKGVVLSLGAANNGDFKSVAELRSANPIEYAKDGKLIPLSERFSIIPMQKRSVAYNAKNDNVPTASDSVIDWEEGRKKDLDNLIENAGIPDGISFVYQANDSFVQKHLKSGNKEYDERIVAREYGSGIVLSIDCEGLKGMQKFAKAFGYDYYRSNSLKNQRAMMNIPVGVGQLDQKLNEAYSVIDGTWEDANKQNGKSDAVDAGKQNIEKLREENFVEYLNELHGMSDEQLLSIIGMHGFDASKAALPEVYEVYDERHGDDYEDGYNMMYESVYDITDAQDALDRLQYAYNNGVFASDARCNVAGQIDALSEWIAAYYEDNGVKDGGVIPAEPLATTDNEPMGQTSLFGGSKQTSMFGGERIGPKKDASKRGNNRGAAKDGGVQTALFGVEKSEEGNSILDNIENGNAEGVDIGSAIKEFDKFNIGDCVIDVAECENGYDVIIYLDAGYNKIIHQTFTKDWVPVGNADFIVGSRGHEYNHESDKFTHINNAGVMVINHDGILDKIVPAQKFVTYKVDDGQLSLFAEEGKTLGVNDQLSLFGNHEALGGTQLDLFEFEDGDVTGIKAMSEEQEESAENIADLTKMKLRKLEPGEFCLMERYYTEKQGYSFMKKEGKVESYQDVAYIFKQLEDSAVEHAFAVLVKDGIPTVIHLGTGGIAQTTVDLRLIRPAVERINPDAIYFVHNHPSGNPRPSNADYDIAKSLRDNFGNKVRDCIIIDTYSGEFGTFNERRISNSENKEHAKSDRESAVKVYAFDKKRFVGNETKVEKIRSSMDAARFISTQRLGLKDKMCALILSSGNEVVGNIHLPFKTIKGNEKKIANMVSNTGLAMNGIVCIIYGNNADYKNAKKLSDEFDVAHFKMMDVILVGHNIKDFPEHYISASENAVMEPEVQYNAQTVNDVEGSSDRVRKGESGNPIERKDISRLKASFGEYVGVKEKDAIADYLNHDKYGADVYEQLVRHNGTPWAKQTFNAILIRIALNDILSGREASVNSFLTKETQSGNLPTITQMIMRSGEDGLWGYLNHNTSVLGSPAKCVNSVDGSYLDCRPSDDCAKFCYASIGNYKYSGKSIISELTHWALVNNPERLADMIANEYKCKIEYAEGKALRLFDKGDISEEWIPVIAELNKRGIVCQIFSKRPEVIEKVDRTSNVVMMSIDRSNAHMLEKYNDLPIAFVYTNKDDLPLLESQRVRFEKFGGSILPVKQGVKILDEENLKALPKWATAYTCPIDKGVKTIGINIKNGEWNCTRCDKGGGVGCFFGRTAQKLKEKYGKDTTGSNSRTDIGAKGRPTETSNEGVRSLVGTNTAVQSIDIRRELQSIIRESGVSDANVERVLLEKLVDRFHGMLGRRNAQLDGEGKGFDNLAAGANLEEGEGRGETERGDGGVIDTRFRLLDESIPSDAEEIKWLNEQETEEVYHSMQLLEIDGKKYLFPPMAAVQAGKMVMGIPVNEDGTVDEAWEKAVENPDLAYMMQAGDGGKRVDESKAPIEVIDGEYYWMGKPIKCGEDGKPSWYFDLKKGSVGEDGKKLGDTAGVLYDPYQHSSTSPLNDQFTSAYNRGHLVTVKVKVPKIETGEDYENNYKAAKAGLTTGSHPWKGGVIANKLKGEDERKVILSRWDKVVRIVPDTEVAAMIKDIMDRNGIESMPFNVVTPGIREALVDLGVNIGSPEGLSNDALSNANKAYYSWMYKGSSKRDVVELLAERWNAKVNIVENVEDITHPNEKEQEKRRRAKGWYDIRTGEVTVVLPNNTNVGDVVMTMAHEIVGHKGLRELVGAENYDAFLDEVYSHLNKKLKEKVNAMTNKMVIDGVADKNKRKEYVEQYRRVAVDELFGKMAEKHIEDMDAEEKTLWQKIKEKVRDWLDNMLGGALKLPKAFKIGDNEMRYMIWKSQQNIEGGNMSPIDMARDISKRMELDISDVVMRDDEGPEVGGNGGGRIATSTTRGDMYRDIDTPAGHNVVSYEERVKSAEAAGYTKKQYDGYRQRVWNNMHGVVAETASVMNIGDRVEVIDNPDEMELTDRQRKAKGWYDPKSGKIVINMMNHHSSGDVFKTMMHEAVAHYGLRKLFGDRFDKFLDNVYKWGDAKAIDNIMRKSGADRRTATEEYLANLAEDMDFENAWKMGWWSKVKIEFLTFMHEIGLGNWVGALDDAELRYLLWRSYENLKNPDRYNNRFGGNGGNAETITDEQMVARMRENEAPAVDAEGSAVLFREGDDATDRQIVRDGYERMMASGANQWKEAMQDSMLSLKRLYQTIVGKDTKIEDVPDYENAYLAENRMRSAAQEQTHVWHKDFVEPLIEQVYMLTHNNKKARQQLIDYMMAKHGLERNEVLARRDARKAANDKFSQELFDAQRNVDENPGDELFEEELDAVKQRMFEYEEEQYHKNRETDYAGLTALTEKEDVGEAELEAQQMVAAYEDNHDVQQLWNAVNRATRSSLQKTFECGMMDFARYEQVRDMFEYYIPLQGFDEKVAEEAYAYMGSDGTLGYGTPIRTAKGRKSKADDPIATLVMNGEAAIRQGNRNLMKQRFLNFVQAHPSDLVSIDDVWLRKNEVTGEWEQYFDADLKEDDSPEVVEQKVKDFEERMRELKREKPDMYMRNTDRPDIPFRVLDPKDMKQHQVSVRRNGRMYVITINGNPRAAQALNGMSNPDVDTEHSFGRIMNFFQAVNRWRSLNVTSRNPAFMLSNFIRDMFYANTQVWVKESPNYAMRFHKNFGRVNPIMLFKMYNEYEKGNLRGNAKIWELNGADSNSKQLRVYFNEFMQNGGETGWTNLRDIENIKKELTKSLRRYGNNPAKAWQWLDDMYNMSNSSVENCARFAAYVTSREMGRSIGRSVFDAKEISVNFNKKGAGDKFMMAKNQKFIGRMGAFLSGFGRGQYMFWNASLQGLNNFARNGVRHPGKFSALITSLFAMGAMQYLISALVSGDDDDEYYNLPEYTRRSNICFRWSKDMPWVTLPLPVEYRAVFGLGELCYGWLMNKEHYTDAEFAKQAASQVSQIMPIDFLEGGGGLHAAWPDVLKPIVEVEQNRSWNGMPIHRKETEFNQYDPRFTLAYPSANKQIVDATKAINSATGGSDVTQGSVDLNPANIEYLMRAYLGGPFTMYNQMQKAAETALGSREFEWRNMPFASRVVYSGGEDTENRKIKNQYFDLRSEHERVKHDLGKLKKQEEAGGEDVLQYADRITKLESDKYYPHYIIMEHYKPIVDAIYKEMKSASDTERKEMEAQEFEIMKECVGLVNAYDNGDVEMLDSVLLGNLRNIRDNRDTYGDIAHDKAKSEVKKVKKSSKDGDFEPTRNQE